MGSFAAVVLAHADPRQVRRLIHALDEVPLVLQCDARTAPEMFESMTAQLPRRVYVNERVASAAASWSLVEAELAGLRAAVRMSQAEHIAVVSGADYPLVTSQRIAETLDAWQDRSWFWNQPMPYEAWSIPRHPDGGMWRVRFRYLTRHGHVRYVRGIPLRWPIPRSIPAGLELRAGSQWKIYCRRDVETILKVVDTSPELMRFWRTTLVPDESFAASVLASQAFSGSEPLQPMTTHPWLIRWDPVAPDHPLWLTANDLPALRDAAHAPALDPAAALAEPADGSYQRLFARKFATARSADLLDALDLLRVTSPSRD